MSDNSANSPLILETLQSIDYIQERLGAGSRVERNLPAEPQKRSEVEEKLDKVQREIEHDIVPNKIVVKSICAVLTRISGDTFEIAKAITPVLVTLSLSKSIPVATEPFAIALVAIVIGRMGVAILCPDS